MLIGFINIFSPLQHFFLQAVQSDLSWYRVQIFNLEFNECYHLCTNRYHAWKKWKRAKFACDLRNIDIDTLMVHIVRDFGKRFWFLLSFNLDSRDVRHMNVRMLGQDNCIYKCCTTNVSEAFNTYICTLKVEHCTENKCTNKHLSTQSVKQCE